MADMSEFLASQKAYFDEHLQKYLATDGAEGHLVDATHAGGHADTTALLIKTIGRKSGKLNLTPIFYYGVNDEFAIVASKAGADSDPAWFLNLQAAPDVRIQVRDKKYRASWRIAEGEERVRLWRKLAAFYPPYDEYQERTERRIPVVLLSPIETLSEL